jgi:hypothetical protein
MTNWEAYGPPSIEVGALRIWVHGYESAESADVYDGNWLRITAHCAVSGASVVVTGSILDTGGISRFQTELQTLYERLAGTAILESHEPELKVSVKAEGKTGQMQVETEITPDHLNQAHRFQYTIDQSYLPRILAGCERVLQKFPVRNADRGSL